ncbi:hypothetical protein ABGB12_13775 [Actinocorallia sp. B10E7]|uniref:hypothetical protein n=1 Tax=Actinocorallia sp. B10E7 TaxID=3153558 RepID=UPI00325CD2DA
MAIEYFYSGTRLRPVQTRQLARVLQPFLAPDEPLLALVATVKTLPRLTHLAVTGRRLLGFRADTARRSGPGLQIVFSEVLSVASLPSFQQRWSLSVTTRSGEELDFGSLHPLDSSHLVPLIQSLLSPPRAVSAPPPLLAPPAPSAGLRPIPPDRSGEPPA